jgi:translation initiation factor IF-2
VNDNDARLAISAKGVVIAFKNKIDKAAKVLAEANGVPVISSPIIYELVKAVEDFLIGKAKGGSSGILEILALFNQKKLEKQLVGGKVISGVIRNRFQFDIERAGVVVGAGWIMSLRSGKKEVSQIEEGNETGFVASSQIPIMVGDKIMMRPPAK